MLQQVLDLKKNESLNLVNENYIYNKLINLKSFSKFPKFNLKNLKKKVIEISQTSTTISGCKRKSTRVITVIGNNNGAIGLGIGRSINKIKAYRLSFFQAKKELIFVPTTRNLSIPLFTSARFCSSAVKLYPTFNKGGIKSAGPTRTILELAGLKNLTSNRVGSSNIFNTAQATLLALTLLSRYIERLSYESTYYKTFFKNELINAQYFIT